MVNVNIPKELHAHAVRLTQECFEHEKLDEALRFHELHHERENRVKKAMASMFVAGWLDWAMNAKTWVAPEVKDVQGRHQEGPAPR